jgi:hypothetical protein
VRARPESPPPSETCREEGRSGPGLPSPLELRAALLISPLSGDANAPRHRRFLQPDGGALRRRIPRTQGEGVLPRYSAVKTIFGGSVEKGCPASPWQFFSAMFPISRRHVTTVSCAV